MIKHLISTLLLLGVAGSALACNTEYNITLQTFGEGVLVELRSGSPGNSRVVQSRRSNGVRSILGIFVLETTFLRSVTMILLA